MEMSIAAERGARVAERAAPGRTHPRARPSAASPPTGRYGSASSTGGSPTRYRCCRAATSRRSCWPSGLAAARRCSSWTSRPAASTWAPRPRCTTCSTELAGEGVAILMISSELPEVLRVGDRILVMREGRLVAEFTQAEASEEGIMAAATGQLGAEAPMTATLAPPREPGSPASRARAGSRSGVFRVREFGIVAVLIVFVAITAAIQPRFLSSHQHPVRAGRRHDLRAAGAGRDDGGDQPERRPVGRLGAGALRVPHPPTCSARRTASHSRSSSWPAWASGSGFGAINGLLVSLGRVPSLVVTLATLYIIRGLDVLIVGGGQVVADLAARSFLTSPRRRWAGSRTWRSWSPWSSRSGRTTCAGSGRAVSCTRSARTRTRPGSRGFRSGGASSPRSR